MKLKLTEVPSGKKLVSETFTLLQVAEFLEINVEDLAYRMHLADSVSVDGYTFEAVRETGSGFKENRTGTE